MSVNSDNAPADYGRVFSTRLPPKEAAAFERAARKKKLKPSGLLRRVALRAISESKRRRKRSLAVAIAPAAPAREPQPAEVAS